MAYDHELAARVREALTGEPGVTEKAMFGGLAFLVDGAMVVAAGSRGALMVRCDPARTEELVDDVHVTRVVMRGRAMNGWLDVAQDALVTDADLQRWVEVGLAFLEGRTPPR